MHRDSVDEFPSFHHLPRPPAGGNTCLRCSAGLGGSPVLIRGSTSLRQSISSSCSTGVDTCLTLCQRLKEG